LLQTSSHIRQIVGSRRAALETLLVLRQVVSKARFSNIDQLIEIIHGAGRRLAEAQPKGKFRLLHRTVFVAYIVQSSPSETLSERFYIIYAKSTEPLPRRHLRTLPSPSPNSYTKANLAGEV